MNFPRFKTPPVGAQILFAIGVNLAQTAVCIWTGGAENIAWGFMLVTCGLYIVLINAVNRGQVPEAVRTAYVSSMAVQILLNIIGVVPPDSGWLSGIGQLLYCVVLVIAAIVGSIVNHICASYSVRVRQGTRPSPDSAALMKHLVIAGVLNALQISLCLNTRRVALPLIFMLITDLLYIIWSAYDTDSRTMWSAYLGFVIPCGLQFTVIIFDLLSPDWSSDLYCCTLPLIAFIYGTADLIRSKVYTCAIKDPGK